MALVISFQVQQWIVGIIVFNTVPALLLAWHSKGCSVKEACEKTVNSLSAVLQRTESHKSKELKLIQSKADLESPSIIYRAETLKS